MAYAQRDIVLVPFPFSNLSTSKKRPAVVISSTTHNSTSPDIVVVAITSNVSSNFGGILIDSQDLELGALPVKSLIRSDKIYTLDQSIIIKSFGKLSLSTFEDLLDKVCNVFGR